MRIVSWNIQWGRGADGRVDLARTLDLLQSLAPDLICLQEVACNFPDLEGGRREDEPAFFRTAFPAWESVYAPGVDVPDGEDGRSAFGNLVLSRFPLGQVWRRSLPWPADPGVPSMQRSCAEAVVMAPGGAFRILTTHLEYYSAAQRLAQARALRELQLEALAQAAAAPSEREKDGPFRARPLPAAALLCGDFNCEPGSPGYQALTETDASGVPAWVDAWTRLHGEEAHASSVGLHGAEWPDHPYCCDFAFVSPALASRLRSVRVEQDTAASDHQPVLVELGD